MTDTESRALVWLAEKAGCAPGQIKFQGRDSPDFILPDGSGYEVKLLTHHHFNCSLRQMKKLLAFPNCQLVLWRKGAVAPEAVIPCSVFPNIDVRGYHAVLNECY